MNKYNCLCTLTGADKDDGDGKEDDPRGTMLALSINRHHGLHVAEWTQVSAPQSLNVCFLLTFTSSSSSSSSSASDFRPQLELFRTHTHSKSATHKRVSNKPQLWRHVHMDTHLISVGRSLFRKLRHPCQHSPNDHNESIYNSKR